MSVNKGKINTSKNFSYAASRETPEKSQQTPLPFLDKPPCKGERAGGGGGSNYGESYIISLVLLFCAVILIPCI